MPRGVALQRAGVVAVAYQYSRWVGKVLVLTLLFACDDSIRDPQPSTSTDADESSIVVSTKQPKAGSTASRSGLPIDDATELDTPQTASATDTDTSSEVDVDRVADDERISLINSRITSESQTVTSAQSVTLTLTLYDAQGVVLTDAEADVVFTAVGGSSTGQFSTVVRSDDGTYTVKFTGLVAGSATTIGAKINGQGLISTLPTLTVTPGETDPAHSIITVAQNVIQTLGTTTIRLTTYDRHGNRRTQGGDTVSFRLSGGTSAGNFGSIVLLGDGSYECSFTGVTAGTAAQLAATINDTPISSSAMLRVTNASGLAGNSQVSVSSSTVASGSSVTITLRAIMADGQPDYFRDHVVTFRAQGGSSTGTFSSATNNYDGTYTATFIGMIAGTATTVSTSIDGVVVTTTSPTITVMPGPVSVNQSVLEVSQSAIASTNTATVRLITKDAAGNLLRNGGHTVVFYYSGGTSTGVIGSILDSDNGTYSATFTGITAGTATALIATLDGVPITTTSPTISVSPGPISPAQSVITVSSSTVDIGSSVTVTLHARDAVGNLAGPGTPTVSFSLVNGGSSEGVFSSLSNHNNGTYTAIFTGTSAGSPATIGATIDGNAVTTAYPTITVQSVD